MLKTIITDAIVSPGYEGAPALKFSEKGDAARFRIGKKVYDPKDEDSHRCINLSVKAFGPLCQELTRNGLISSMAEDGIQIQIKREDRRKE